MRYQSLKNSGLKIIKLKNTITESKKPIGWAQQQSGDDRDPRFSEIKNCINLNNKDKKTFLKRASFPVGQQQKIHIVQVPEGQKDCGTEKVFKEIMVENFPNFIQNTNLQIQETGKIPKQINRNQTKIHISEN